MKTKLILIFIFCVSLIWAAGIEVSSYVDNTKIGIEDNLRYSIEVSGESTDDVRMPDLSNMKDFYTMGTSQSSSSSFSIINGKMESKKTETYVYSLKPKKTGRFIIPSFAVKFKGKKYFTKPVSIQVVPGSIAPAPDPSASFFGNNMFPSHQNQQRRIQPQQNNSSTKISDNIFIKSIVSKRNLYVGEPVTITYELYTRYDLNNLSYGSDPDFKGMWKEETYKANRVSFHRVTYNNKLYNVMKIATFSAFPTQTGQLSVTPMKLTVSVTIQPRSFFDFGTSKSYDIKSKTIFFNVKDLPENGKPSSFNGAVGNFKINTDISSNRLKVGDSFTFTIKISGRGNIGQFDAPKLPELNNFRIMDPEIKDNLNSDKISGNKTAKFLVIAQEKGDYEIPSMEFSYFDPKLKKYVVRKTASYPVKVTEGNSTNIPIIGGKIDISSEGRDIEFISTESDLKNFKPLFDNWIYWLVWVILFLFIPLSAVMAKESEKLSSNVDYYRQKRAEKIIKKYLKDAQNHASKGEIEFYSATQTGLTNYIADKLGIPRGSTTSEILKKLEERKLDVNLIENIKTIYQKCDQARFMPGGFSKENIKEDFGFLQKTLGRLTRKI